MSGGVRDYNKAWFTSGGIEKLGKLLDACTTESLDVDPYARIDA